MRGARTGTTEDGALEDAPLEEGRSPRGGTTAEKAEAPWDVAPLVPPPPLQGPGPGPSCGERGAAYLNRQ